MKKSLLGLIFIGISTLVNAQVGIGTSDPKATLDVTAVNSSGNITTTEGILIPRVDRERAQSMDVVEKSTMIYVNSIATGTQTGKAINIDTEGFYYFNGTNWVKLSSATSASPQFFYMPSIVLPTTPAGTAGTQVTEVNGVYTVDLYTIFKAQFDTSIKSSNGAATGLQGFVLDRNKYEYHIIYADGSVFPHVDIIFLSDAGNEGKLTYKVDPNAIARYGSFMNIVLKVK